MPLPFHCPGSQPRRRRITQLTCRLPSQNIHVTRTAQHPCAALRPTSLRKVAPPQSCSRPPSILPINHFPVLSRCKLHLTWLLLSIYTLSPSCSLLLDTVNKTRPSRSLPEPAPVISPSTMLHYQQILATLMASAPLAAMHASAAPTEKRQSNGILIPKLSAHQHETDCAHAPALSCGWGYPSFGRKSSPYPCSGLLSTDLPIPCGSCVKVTCSKFTKIPSSICYNRPI